VTVRIRGESTRAAALGHRNCSHPFVSFARIPPMSATIWEVQLDIRNGAKSFGPDPGSPYAGSGVPNHLERFDNAQRASTKRDHAIAHCQAMASYYRARQAPHLALDWIVASLALAGTADQA